MKLFLYCFRAFDEKQYFDALQEKFDFTYGASAEYPNLDNAALAAGYDAICTTVTEINEKLLECFSKLGVRFIISRSIGIDHIDLKAAKRLGLRVSHVSYGPETVADYTIMLMMMGLRRMRQVMERAAVQDYTLKGKLGRDICECTIGVIGTGQIGRTVIRHLKPFGCRLLAYDLYEDPQTAGICQYTDLETIYRECDVITLHMPANSSNYHMLDRHAFEQMKTDCLLVNTARGTLVDTDALITALESGRLSGAALDVIEDENGLYYMNRVGDCIANRQMAQLRAMPNVILTPHTAFYTDRVVRSMAEQTVRGMFDMEHGVENPLIVL